MANTRIKAAIAVIVGWSAGCYFSARPGGTGSDEGGGGEGSREGDRPSEADSFADELPDAWDGNSDPGFTDEMGDGNILPDDGGAADDPETDGPDVTESPDDALEVPADSGGEGSDGDSETGDGGIVRTWVTITPGTFMMGSSWVDCSTIGGERPRHEVRLTRAFEMLSTEVTVADYLVVMGYPEDCRPRCTGSDDAVACASWHKAASYCNALSSAAGLASCYACSGGGSYLWCDLDAAYASPYDCPGYRLPTEAEWEYAARAGTATDTYNGDISPLLLDDCATVDPALDPIARYCANRFSTCDPVGTKLPNSWGLYDMLGNIEEWCHDWENYYESDPAYVPGGTTIDPWGPTESTLLRVVRGGSALSMSRCTRCASRHEYGDVWGPPPGVGFRPVRTLF